MEVSAPLRPAAPRCDALRSRHNRTEPRAEHLLAANNFRVLLEPRPRLGARLALSAWRKDQDAIIAAWDDREMPRVGPSDFTGICPTRAEHSHSRRALTLIDHSREIREKSRWD